MRRLKGRSPLLALFACLAAAARAGAGLYNTAEPAEAPAGPIPTPMEARGLAFEQFRRGPLADALAAASSRPESPIRLRFKEHRDRLQRKLSSGAATAEDRLNLSAYLIRLGQYEEASEALQPVATRDQRNFMVFANLATANQLAGRPDRALLYLQQAKDVWPASWPGMTGGQLAWYRRAEDYHLKLLRLRYREALRAGSGAAPEQVDDLFGPAGSPVRFLAEDGRYAPGKIGDDERKKLPPDAPALVEQLLIWLPSDTRLYWLLGEVLNAEGRIDEAAAALDDCVASRGWNAPALREHRRVLREYRPAADQPRSPAGPGSDTVPAPSRSGPWRPGAARLLLVGALAGVPVLALAWLQVRQMRRRRRRNAG